MISRGVTNGKFLAAFKAGEESRVEIHENSVNAPEYLDTEVVVLAFEKDPERDRLGEALDAMQYLLNAISDEMQGDFHKKHAYNAAVSVDRFLCDMAGIKGPEFRDP